LNDPGLRPDPTKMIRLLDGKPSDSRTVREKAAVIACGNQLPSSNAVYGFTSDQELLDWCDGLPVGAAIHRAYREAERLQRLEKEGEAALEAAVREAAEAAAADLQRIAKRLGKPEASREAFLAQAGLGDAPPRAALAQLAILYDGVGFTGKVRPTPISVPKLSWIGIDNQVSAAKVFGRCFLAEDTFFRGKKGFLLGFPYFELDDLALIDFDNRASSLLFLP
jgi:hypothetical protein